MTGWTSVSRRAMPWEGNVMRTNIARGSEELRIIGHAINWQLNVPFERSAPPRFNERETEVLSRLFADVCELNRRCLSGMESVSLEVGEPYLCAGGRMRLPPDDFRMMTEAIASFLSELGSSPSEIEIVTGAPSSKTAELLSRLRAA